MINHVENLRNNLENNVLSEGTSFLTLEELWTKETRKQIEVETRKDMIMIPEIIMEIASYLYPEELFALIDVE
ncbi:hypothetical protein F8M41_010378 [Gigaspora margarita]|uniref:Uncharacterized protein n=1 Tax=Gigaspora margarita TaxID=4874 RepID=A0A8H3X3Y6_GIGMA|nr:hypothetical protein F8M41_010378 [Gigaspora margarita]